MKRIAAFPIFLAAQPALAHPGHLTELAGHDHVVAGIAIGAAIGVAIWGAWKGKKDKHASDEAEETKDPEPQEA